MSPSPAAPPPDTAEGLTSWIAARTREPSVTWIPVGRLACSLPWPVNLPGMPAALAALIARYWFMQPEWHADVIQDFMGRWLLRPGSAHTIARSAIGGVVRGKTTSLEAGIAWKLRLELLSQAHRAYRRTRRHEQRQRELERLAAEFESIVREAAWER